ncbi:hypothetical protein L3X38_039574 [Prunus dulcis]|uniref:Uncharacterized protein n=1 Tax=Prunus dulcis TaxID=3755 RepID=A0AAD4YSK2_PRUDU|nr:hypothetical protein L3X38_039574 [Prunus dulcis]
MKMEAWNLAEAKLPADRRNHEAGMDLDVHNAAEEGNVDALWQHREHVDQVLTPTKDTVLSHCPGCCEQLLIYRSAQALKPKWRRWKRRKVVVAAGDSVCSNVAKTLM